MTAAYNDRHQIESSPTARHNPGITARLTGHWPKVAVLFGIVLTFAWITALAWMAIFVLDFI